MIKSEDISVVVQGAIDKNLTPKCLNSIKKYLPMAEIILSTWEGSDVEGCIYNKIIFNKDPGAFSNTKDGNRLFNLNRYLLSSKVGIEKATRKYILKIRSDIVLKNCNFLKYFDKFTKRNDKYSVFKHKVLTSSLYTITGELGTKEETGKIHLTPYHISDWWHFGFAEDIKLLYSCKLIENFEDFAQYFKNPQYELEWLNHRTWKFPPEQYLGVELAKIKFPDLEFNDCLDTKNINMEQSLNFILDNFITLDFQQSGVLLEKDFGYCSKYICKKFWKIPPHVYYTMYNFVHYKITYFSLYPNFGILCYLHLINKLRDIIYYWKNKKILSFSYLTSNVQKRVIAHF